MNAGFAEMRAEWQRSLEIQYADVLAELNRPARKETSMLCLGYNFQTLERFREVLDLHDQQNLASCAVDGAMSSACFTYFSV